MALTDESNNGTGMIMPVQPMGYGGYNGGGGYAMPYAVPYAMPVAYGYGGGCNNGGFGDGFGGDASWLILFLILAMGGWGNGNGFGGGFGGWGGNDVFPWLIASETNTDNALAAGFNQQSTAGTLSGIQSAITSGFGDTQLGIAGVNNNICQTAAGITNAVNQGFSGVQQSLCNGFANTNQTIQNGFAQAEISDNARQMANMQQAFNSQTAITGAINNLSAQQAECCCENRLQVANLGAQIAREACADRETVNNGVRDLLVSGTSNTQAMLNAINGGIQSIQDKLCQQELDAERRENQNLRTQLNMANLAASQTAQTARILDNNNAQTAALLADNARQTQILNPTPVPAYVVQNPNCCQNTCGCGCGFN